MSKTAIGSIGTLLAFSALIGMGLLFASKSTRLQSRISVLKGQNSILEERNAQLSREAEGLIKQIDSLSERAAHFERRDAQLSQKNIELENKIKLNQKRHETIRPRVDGFNADSLRRYFTTIE